MLPSSLQRKTEATYEPAIANASNGVANLLLDVFSKWSRLLQERLGAADTAEALAQSELERLLTQAQADNGAIRNEILLRLSDIKSSPDRREYVHIHQTLLTKLMNQIFLVIRSKPVKLDTIKLMNEIYLAFQQTLNFIKDFFVYYFDFDEKMPIRMAVNARQELKQHLDFVKEAWVSLELAGEALPRAFLDYAERFCLADTTEVSYYEMEYHRLLLEEMRTVPVAITAAPVRERLYYLNFNEPGFVEEEYEWLRRLMRQVETPKQKIGALKLEQKRINQFKTKLHSALTNYLPSLKEQVNNWINEEVRFLESGYYTASPEQDNGYADKIHTSLSVAKLGLLIRLMVVDKIIINRSVAPMLRIVAKIFSTLQRDDVSFGSLEAKYHAPDKATIIAVRDMLFKWINVLGKL